MSREKVTLRKKILSELEEMDQPLFQAKCARIHRRLFKEAQWLQAQMIAVTLSMGKEIETTRIISRAWEENKGVAVPKCDPRRKELTFYRIHSLDQLAEGFYGLKEPIPERTTVVTPEQLDLVIVPGVVFDPSGNRIGYGGGYYDRFLSGYRGRTVSLLLEMQLAGTLPSEKHDRRIDQLITEDRTIDVKMNRLE
ncbi:5-formyltetrahydrofolate cyclo-ligase [Sporolactobacillus vineae]|uniref:5-formyltetrahydrofolate cyclo-ligase n=1 Tax=Sporolactobacillus vineae TaxID=444463 RepID=UPI000474BD5F|nr:5-formyltetrahydrofolate cyclo-ligase [Sporolactobacillus vineae]